MTKTESVASLCLTNLDDSESLLDAYRRKKAEVERHRKIYHGLEADLSAEREKSRLLEDENRRVRESMKLFEKRCREAL